jgi:glutamyl-tRNA synthetase
MVKGIVHYDGQYISDPIVIREDGTMTYMLCSTIDDAEYNISHIIRGEDHVSNTAVQIQMFESLGYKVPECGHLSLVKTSDDKISKRKGGFEIAALRDQAGLEPMAINSFFSCIGTSNQLVPYNNMDKLLEVFEIRKFSTSPTTYMPEELTRLNHKMVVHMEYKDVKMHLKAIEAEYITEEFFLAVRANLETVNDVIIWWKICHELPTVTMELDKALLKLAHELLPSGKIEEDTWKNWTAFIASKTGLKGRELFLPLRLALTGMDHGPEMAKLLPLIGREGVLMRLANFI